MEATLEDSKHLEISMKIDYTKYKNKILLLLSFYIYIIILF